MMIISGPLNEGIKKWNSEFKKKKGPRYEKMRPKYKGI